MTQTYNNFKFILFFVLIQDESKLSDYNISEENWQEVKSTWIQRHEDWSTDTKGTAHKNELKSQARYNRLLLLKERETLSDDGLKELYKKAGITFHKGKVKRQQHIDREIAKYKRLHTIFSAQLENIEESKEDEKHERDSIEIAYEAIASLELAGATIPEYENLTLGKYEALTSMIKKKNQKNGRSN